MLHEVRDERDGLDGFPQPHLVGQDAVQVVVVQRHQPLQPFDLVLLEDPVDHQRGLFVHPLGDGVGHRVVRLQAPGQRLRHPVLIVHVLLGVLDDVPRVHLGHIVAVGIRDLLLLLHGQCGLRAGAGGWAALR